MHDASCRVASFDDGTPRCSPVPAFLPLAALHAHAAQYVEAEALLREALQGARAAGSSPQGGPVAAADPAAAVASVLNDLAVVLASAGRYEARPPSEHERLGADACERLGEPRE